MKLKFSEVPEDVKKETVKEFFSWLRAINNEVLRLVQSEDPLETLEQVKDSSTSWPLIPLLYEYWIQARAKKVPSLDALMSKPPEQAISFKSFTKYSREKLPWEV